MSTALSGAIAGRRPDALAQQTITAIVTIEDPEPKRKSEPPISSQVSVIEAKDPYERMRTLVRDSDMLVIMDGENGTKAELLMALMEINLAIQRTGKSEKMIIIVGVEGGLWDEVYPEAISASDFEKIKRNFVFVENPDEAAVAVEKLFQDKIAKEDK
jgi:predicted Rossmann-fold nucleotide-binding protein